jgi:hypothetical protein
MKTNVGGVDRVVRIIAGLAIIAAGVAFKSWWGAIGALLLLTGLIRWCPAYLPFGLSTGKVKGT